MLFETRKIQLETLGEYLLEVRTQLGLSPQEVGARTSVAPKFLALLEGGDFARLPADVYVYGFLRELAELYGVDGATLVSQYKKERAIMGQLEKRKAEERRRGGQLERLVITPKVLTVSLAALFVAATVGYLVWQVVSIDRTPELSVDEPKDRQIVRDAAVTVAGKTDPGMAVTINDQPVFVDSEGKFKTQVSVGAGPKELVFVAKNKFDKSVTKTVSVIGEPAQPPGRVSGAAAAAPLSLTLSFSAPAQVTYRADGGEAVSASRSAGQTLAVAALDQVILSTDNAGALTVRLNGKDLGALGRRGEPLSNVSFSAESATIAKDTLTPR